ncbi:MAG: EAL domain-containing protein [Saccharospirillum sp.]|uniref:bifunctional diguanylate cyclase/phosphodiesterase n=1 Tax=Saccharospirillum sp. TaxID=2033801 RepID=UPI003299C7B2
MTDRDDTQGETERLNSLYRLNLLDTSPEKRFDHITELARGVFVCDAAMISLVDEKRQWFKSHPGLDLHETPIEQSFCVHAIKQDGVYVIEDTLSTSLFSNNQLVTDAPGIRFYAGAPLFLVDGQKIGTLCLIDSSPRAFSEQDRLHLRLLADITEGQVSLTDQMALNQHDLQQQAYSKAVLTAMPDMIFVVDNKGVFLQSNDHAKQAVKNDDLLGKTLHDILPVDLADKGMVAIDQAIASGDQVTYEYQMDIEGPSYYEARVKSLNNDQVIFVIRDITSEVIAEAELTKSRALVNAIVNAQSQFIHEEVSEQIFQMLLDDLLKVTESEYGFVGEVRFENEQPYIVAKAISEVLDDNRFFEKNLQEAEGELEFRRSDTLLAATLNSSDYLISNSPHTDDRRGGVPDGHPTLASFIGIPMRSDGKLIAMLGLANRQGGYHDDDYQALKPLINTIGQLFDAIDRRSKADWSNRQIHLLSEVSRQTSNGIIISDLEGRIEWVNDAFQSITGYEFDEVVGKIPGSFLQGPETDPEVVEYMGSCIRAQQGFSVELINYTKTHRPYWIDVSCSTLKDKSGKVTGFLAIQNNIDDQKRNEIATKDSLRLQQAILNTMTDGLVTTDSKGIIQTCNRATERIFGYASEELIGKSIKVFMPEIYSKHHDKYMESYKSNESKFSIMGRTRDLTGKRSDGTYFPLEIAVSETQHEGSTLYVAVIRDITESKNQQMAIEKLAYFDPLTDLANRRLLDDRIQQVMALSTRSNSYSAMLLFDLDDFKNINDSLGHRFGDRLLIELGHRISNNVWHGDTAARLGGDEFCLLLTSLGDNEIQAMERASVVADRVLEEMRKPYFIDERRLKTSASIGISIFKGESVEQSDLMRQADIAMYEAKKQGKNRVCFFNREMEQRILLRLERQQDLRQAIAEDALLVHYQPKVDQNSNIVGLEALVRWFHPTDGWISPEEFIPIAEDHQLIIPLGNFVLRQALKDLERWLVINPELNWTLAVNISQYQLSSELFQHQVDMLLQEINVNPASLMLEVTESALAEQIDISILHMNALKELGVTFSLDDFGTGYSSLAYLKQLPIKELKIDKSFVNDLPGGVDDVKIVNSILSLAKAMDLDVVAEGVESIEQFNFLIEGKCDQFQGYYFSRPLAASDIDVLANDNRPLISK